MRQFPGLPAAARMGSATAAALVLCAAATATAQDGTALRLQVANNTGYTLQVADGLLGDGACHWQAAGSDIAAGASATYTVSDGISGTPCDAQLTVLNPGSGEGAGMLTLSVENAGIENMIVEVEYGPLGGDGMPAYSEPVMLLDAPAMGSFLWRLDLAKVGAWLHQHPPAGG